jgi:prolipoprotein diacylglyceryltransferase
VLIVLGIVPGAVVGGRLLHGLDFRDAYAVDPTRLLDPSVGSLSLLGAVLGGLLSGAYVCRLVGAPLRRWADAAAVPLLIALGLGKLAQFLGGSGQGLPFDGPWAVAFVGDGPWVSLNPALAAHPSQIYEGIWLLLGIPLVLRLSGPRHVPLRVDRLVAWADRSVEEGRLFHNVLEWFLVGRLVVGFSWRDDALVGPLNTEQAVALALLAGVELGFRYRAGRHTAVLRT